MSTVSATALLTLLLLITAPPPATDARPVSEDRSALALDLIHRLKLDGGDGPSAPSTSCWDSLVRLQACSGELILFFLNGETYIGDGCCDAIRAIGKQCWPDMLGTLGFTSGERDVLQGYCDGEAQEASGGSDHTGALARKSPAAP